MTLTKTFGLKCSPMEYLSTVVYCSPCEISLSTLLAIHVSPKCDTVIVRTCQSLIKLGIYEYTLRFMLHPKGHCYKVNWTHYVATCRAEKPRTPKSEKGRTHTVPVAVALPQPSTASDHLTRSHLLETSRLREGACPQPTQSPASLSRWCRGKSS